MRAVVLVQALRHGQGHHHDLARRRGRHAQRVLLAGHVEAPDRRCAAPRTSRLPRAARAAWAAPGARRHPAKRAGWPELDSRRGLETGHHVLDPCRRPAAKPPSSVMRCELSTCWSCLRVLVGSAGSCDRLRLDARIARRRTAPVPRTTLVESSRNCEALGENQRSRERFMSR